MLLEFISFDKDSGWTTKRVLPSSNADASYYKTWHDLEMTGVNTNPRHRAELQGKPVFKGWLGPMYGGVGVTRYESQAAYDALSV